MKKLYIGIILVLITAMLCSCGKKMDRDWYVGKEFSDSERVYSLEAEKSEGDIYFKVDGNVVCAVPEDSVIEEDNKLIYSNEVDGIKITYDGTGVLVEDQNKIYSGIYSEIVSRWDGFNIEYIMSLEENGQVIGDIYDYYEKSSFVQEETLCTYNLDKYTDGDKYLSMSEKYMVDDECLECVTIASQGYAEDAVRLSELALNILKINCSEYSYEFNKIKEKPDESFNFSDGELIVEYDGALKRVVVRIINLEENS